MPPIAPLLIPGSIDALRRKLTRADSPLAPQWRRMLNLARHDEQWYYSYAMLAALVTEAPEHRELARRAFMRFVDMADEAMTSNEAQFHTHVTAAPLGRLAIFYDWLADRGVLSPAEDRAFRAALLDHAFIFPLQHVQSRSRGFDNQILANAFAATAVGLVLGVRRGDSALARRLYSSGLTRLNDILARLPEGGYSFEGSTYHEHVVQPLILLSGLLVEQATGAPVMEHGVTPGARSVRELLETCYRMIGPDRLLPPWDAHGYQPATVKAGLAYLARMTGDPDPLRVIEHHTMWYRMAHPAWEVDDSAWAMVFWPDELSAAGIPRFDSWLTAPIGGALQNARTQTRLFQCWDETWGAPNCGRFQVDPNAIALQAYGSPILMDGVGEPDQSVIPRPTQTIIDYLGPRTLETIQEYAYSAWNYMPTLDQVAAMAVSGNIGLSNAIVIDGETWYVPLRICSGRGQALHRVGLLEALRGDATVFYSDRYDVTSMVRSSVLIDGRFVLTCDRIAAKSDHRFTWQAYVRHQTRQEDQAITTQTPEQVRCEIIPLQGGDLSLRDAPGYPNRPDGTSVRVHHTPASGRNVRIDVALLPQEGTRLLADVTDGWMRTIGTASEPVSLRDAYVTDTGEHPETPRRFERKIAATATKGRRVFLTLPAIGSGAALMVNDNPVNPTVAQSGMTWHGAAPLLPIWFDVTDALLTGENRVSFSAPFFHGESALGPVELRESIDPEPATAQRTGDDRFHVQVGPRGYDVIMDRTGGVAAWLGGRTDARYAVAKNDGSIAMAEATLLELPSGLRFRADAPCDLGHTESETTVTRISDGCSLSLSWPRGEVRVEMGGVIEITGRSNRPHRLVLHVPLPRSVVLNGAALDASGDTQHIVVNIPSVPERLEILPPQTPEEVYAIAAVHGRLAGPALVAALNGGDWRVQVAAADVAGRLGVTEAVDPLLRLFVEGEKELPYPPLRKWWRWSKMLRGEGREMGPDPEAPRPLAVKRWRVRRAAATALGKLGDGRAVAPLEAAMAHCKDFFPVTSQLAAALGRLGSPSSIPILERHRNHAEINTQRNALLALALLRGEISRTQFEAGVGAE